MSSLNQTQLEAIAQALRSGNKIEAIKLHREATGLGLKEAKTEIESIEEGLRTKYPEDFPAKKPAGQGCFGVLAVGLASAGLGLGWLLTRS